MSRRSPDRALIAAFMTVLTVFLLSVSTAYVLNHPSDPRFTGGKSTAVGISAAVFVGFGLFVLWWGRDRASLWLGLFCTSFGATLFSFYEDLPSGAALMLSLAKAVLWFGYFYALYAMAETVTLDVIGEKDLTRAAIRVLRIAVIVVLSVGALINIYQLLLLEPEYSGVALPAVYAVIFRALLKVAWVGIFCAAPLLLLATAWLRASDAAKREKARVILLTTVAGLSGPILSISIELARGSGVGFQTIWFTLLAIPLGFVVTIPAYRVVEVKVVVNRILVFTAMTLILGAVIALTETVADKLMRAKIHPAETAGHAASVPAPAHATPFDSLLELAVAFLIVVSFSHLHQFLDQLFKRLVFRRRDDAIEKLHAFANGPAGEISERDALLAQAADVVCQVLEACSAAFYEERRKQFYLAYAADPTSWPERVGENDPVLIALRAAPAHVELCDVRPSGSEIGKTGIAFRMAVGGRMIGALVIGPRARDVAGGYDVEEIEALTDLVRGVSEALFNLRARETVEFVRAIADGRLHGADAVRDAEKMWRRGFAGLDDQLPYHEPAPEGPGLRSLPGVQK